MKIAVLPNSYDLIKSDEIVRNGDFLRDSVLLALSQKEGSVIMDTSWSKEEAKDEELVDFFLRLKFLAIGEQVVLRCKVVEASTGAVLNLKEYTLEQSNWRALNTELSENIFKLFQLDKETINPDEEAYKALVEAQYKYNKFNPLNAQEALALYKQADRLQPNYLDAKTGLAKTYFYLANWSVIDTKMGFKKAKEYALQSLQIKKNHPEALVVLAHVQMYFEKDFVAARNNFMLALNQGVLSASVLEKYAWFLCTIHQYEDALEAMLKASALEPTNLFIKHFIGDIYRYSGNIEVSTKAFKKVLEQEPGFRHSINYIGLNYWLQDNLDQARHYLFKYKSMVPDPKKGLLPLFLYYSKKENWAEMSQLEKTILEDGGEANNINQLLIALIKKDYQSLDRLFLKVWDSGNGMVSLMCDPIFKELRNRKVFKEKHNEILWPRDDSTSFTLQRAKKEVQIGTGQDSLKVKPNNFLFAKAEGNYLDVHYFVYHTLTTSLVRCTLKELVHAFNDSTIVKCHKSFAINLNFSHAINGNIKTRKLIFSDYNFEIPLSRSFSFEESK